MAHDLTSGKNPALTGRRKAAAFLLSLDNEAAAQVLQRLGEHEVAQLTTEMARLGELGGKEVEAVLAEFNSALAGDRVLVAGRVQSVLERAVGKDKAKELIDQAHRQTRASEPFQALAHLDAPQVATLLKGEHPQVLALVIGRLRPAVAAALLKSFPEDLRYEVVKRIASTTDMPAETVRQVDEMIEARVGTLGESLGAVSGVDRYQNLAQLLNLSEPAVSRSILDRLNRETPQLANEISSLMFVFEDLGKIADRDMQRVLSEMDRVDLALALKVAPPELAAKLLGNLSTRARDNLQEEIDLLGPRPLSEVEEARKRIMQQVRAMEERGEIRINRTGEEIMV